MDEHIYPKKASFEDEVAQGDRLAAARLMEEAQAQSAAQGLWNLFRRTTSMARFEQLRVRAARGNHGTRRMCVGAFNCSAPDTGTWNAARYGPKSRNGHGSRPLLAERSAPLSDDEPDVGIFGCDQLASSIRRDGAHLFWTAINGGRPAPSIAAASPHLHGQDGPGRAAPHPAVVILVPIDAHGVNVGASPCRVRI